MWTVYFFAGLPVSESRHMHKTQVLDRQDDSRASLPAPVPFTCNRSLKVEPLGDPWRGKRFAGIRLKGHWLQRAGFRPGQRVTVTISALGTIQLRAVSEPPTEEVQVSEADQTPLALECDGGAHDNMQPEE